jgi:hypothetical protein
MSDTPISDSTPHNVAELGMLCRKFERQLNAANEMFRKLNIHTLNLTDRIKRLEEALGCVVVSCNHLHHRKKHQHRSDEPCPVEELIRKAKEAKP